MELWDPFKWLYKWVIGVITLINGVIILLKNGRGPPCSFLHLFWWTLCCFNSKWNWNISEVVVVHNYHDSCWFYSWRILSNCRTWCVLCISSKEPPLFEQLANLNDSDLGHGPTLIHQTFQVPKMEESWALFSAILGAAFPLHKPYILLIYI